MNEITCWISPISQW